MSTGSSAHLGLVGSTGTTVLLLVGALLVLGVAMVAVTVWLVRSTRTDHVALGPLEVMGDRSFRKADEGVRTTRLTTARPDGAPDPAPIVPLDEVEDPVPVDAPAPVDDDATAEPAAPVAEPVPVEPVEPVEAFAAPEPVAPLADPEPAHVVEPTADTPVDGVDERVEDEAR